MDLRHYEPISDLIFRAAFSLIFIVGGIGHIANSALMMSRFEASPWAAAVSKLADPHTLLITSGVVLMLGGVLLLFGYRARLAACALFFTLVPITIVIHIAPNHVGPLLKNVALLGGLVHFFVRGPGAYSVDKETNRANYN